MNIESVKSAIEEIEKYVGYSGTAHSMEDDLYRDFVKSISTRADIPDDVQEMAKLILNVSRLNFPRWYE